MSLDVIKNLKAEVEALKSELQENKKVSEEIKALEEKIAGLEAARKKTFEEEKISDKEVEKAKRKASDLMLKSKLLNRPVDSFEEYKEVANIIEKAIKPSDISDWLDERFSQDIIEKMELELKVEKLFPSVVVPDGVNSLSLPQKTGGSTAYLIQPATDAIESALTAGKISFSPVKLKTLVTVADETKNEAVISAILDVVREDIAYSLAKGVENAIVNGDTTGGINANPGSTDVTMAFNGLRKFGGANTTDNGGGGITLAKIREARKSMGVFGVDPSELTLLVNPVVFYQLLNIDEVQTIEKFGSEAIIKRGVIAMIDGINIVLTEKIPTNLDASGNVDNTTPGTLTAAVLVNTKAFKVAKRNVVEFESDRNIVNDTGIYTGRVYRDFNKVSIEDNSIALIVNIAQ